MPVEIANRCPRCSEPVYVAPMHAGSVLNLPNKTLTHDLVLGYQCIPCDWFVIQPESNRLPTADFLAAAVGPLRDDTGKVGPL